MTDLELIGRFEGGTTDPGRFGHLEHVRLTWLYLRDCGRLESERRLLSGLRALAARAGKAERFDAALTLAWIARIDRARAALGDHTFDDLLRHDPSLADPRSVREMPQTI
jgi:hypothetical protein